VHRKKFVQTCASSCLGLLTGATLVTGCAGARFLTGHIVDTYLQFPSDAFLVKEGTKQLLYVIVQHPDLKYPVCVYRLSDEEYMALLMRCTHQGTQLQVFGERLECPAHGSAFDKQGDVQNGPAEDDLRTFPVKLEPGIIKIDLS